MGGTVVCSPAIGPGDEPLDAQTAMLFSAKAPLAGSPASGVRSDTMAVWACVPAAFKVGAPEALIYFHGHNYFVTATKSGSSVVARAPGWLSGSRLRAAAAKGKNQGAAGHFYKFDALPSGNHAPLVLLPEDGNEDTSFDMTLVPRPTPQDPNAKAPKQPFWAREGSVGTLSAPSGLGDLLDDCLNRLGCLAPSGPTPPAGAGAYLSKSIASADLKRLFLTGHSGGGVPLFNACRSTFALTNTTSLWAFDATYGDPSDAVRTFCENWDSKSHLGNGSGDSCVVIVYNPGSGTFSDKNGNGGAKAIRANLQSNQGGKKVFTVQEVIHTGPSDVPAVATALKSSPILFIKTTTAHDSIPQTFAPILLANAP